MTTALLLVDVQRDMLDPPSPVPNQADVRRALESLLARAREHGTPVVHVQNDGGPDDPDAPETSGWELVFPAAAGEAVLRKSVSDAFSNPGLEAFLSAHGVDRVVIAGMQSNYCVSATCRGALQHALGVTLASGAHATYDETETAKAIAENVERELAQLGVQVVPVDKVRF